MQVYSGNGQWITADQIKAQSDAMHEKLQSHGYNYINVDAAWNGGMDGYGRPIPSTTLYPEGFTKLIDYVHANGQKFGIYLIPGLSPQAYKDDLPIYGTTDCTMRDIAAQPLRTADYWGIGYKIDFASPCAQKYIDSIADLIASWGVDFVKFDSVTPGSGHNDTTIDARDDVKAWSQALKRHNIWLELSWALDINYADTWKEYADGWRVEWDIECYCGTGGLTKWDNIARLFPKAEQWWRHAGPDSGWNDFDSLNVGNGAMDGITPDERRTAMTLWAVSSAPLYIGNDMTKLDDFGLSLLTNDEVIAVNQAGRPAHPVSTATTRQVWYANNGDGTYTVALFNLGSSPADVNVNWSEIGLQGPAAVRDLWSHSDLGTFASGYSASNVPSHGTRLFRVTAFGGTSTVNDDDTGIRYSGDWKRNDGRELAAAAQNLIVDVLDHTAANSTIAPTTAVFDKKVSAQADVSTTMALKGNTLSAIRVDGTALSPGSDYSVSGSEVTIRKEYLAGRPVGTTGLTFVFSAGAPQTLTIAVSDTTIRDSRVNPATVSFDRNPSAQGDVSLTLEASGNSLTGITQGSRPLAEGADYSVSGNAIVLKKAYLASLPTGTSDMTFSFSGGAPQTVTLVVRDSSQGAIVVLNDDDPSISYAGAWNRSTGRGLGDYKDDVHWTETAGDSFEYAFTGTGVELVTEMDPSQGAIDIYVDGEFKQTVSTYNIGRLAQQTVFNVTGLPYGPHTVKAVKKQSGFFMLLDQVRVLLPDLVTPTAAGFDKAAPADVSVTTAVYGGALSGIRNGGSTLVPDGDYAVTGNTVTVKQSYLANQPIGQTNLSFAFSGGASQTLAIAVTDSAANNSAISPASGSFDKKAGSQADVVATLELNGNTLVGISNGGTALSAGADYAVSGNEVAIKKEYLAARPVGITKLIFAFSAGASQTLTIEVRDTTPANSAVSPSSASFDQNASLQADLSAALTLNGNELTGIANGGAALTEGTDYTVSGSQIAIRKQYLASLPEGMQTLTFSFSGGAPQTMDIAVTDSSRGRYVVLNDDDAGISYTGAWNRSWNRGLGDFKDDVHYAETNGDAFEAAFTGTGVEVVTEKDSSQGDVEIYLDGVYQRTVSTYAPSRQVRQTVFAAAGLPDGAHTLKVVKKSGYYMLLDQLKFRIPDLIKPDKAAFDKTAPEDVTVSLTIDGSGLLGVSAGGTPLTRGTDYTVSGNQVTIKQSYLATRPTGAVQLAFSFRGDLQDDIHYAANNGDSFTYVFTGTGLEWISAKGPSQGDAAVYVDGVYKGTVSAYGAARQTAQTLFRLTGLPNGTHTFKAVKKSGEMMLTDGLRYTVASPVSVNDSDAGIKYKGNWKVSTGRGLGDYGDDVHYTERNGDFLQFKFEGTGVELVTETDASEGEIDIYLDDQYQQTISAYSPERKSGQTVYRVTGLPDGNHVLKALKKSGTYMLLDQFRVITGDAQYNDNDTSISYAGSWAVSSGRGLGDFNDDVHFTETNGDAFTFTFRGRGVELLTEKDASQGDIDIYVDGKFVKTVSTYSQTRLTGQSVYAVDNLSNGTHTLKAVKKSGTFMLLDSLKVSP
uniref:Alpha-galactosidase n=2 Tax=Cohnella candidum TaxID=2674991 RepID=A0A3G3K5N5_9BACL|nr:hypothetical protein EAV92_23475 [Cohnella candidum]